MKRRTTLSGWSRRDKVLASFLAVVGAFGVLARPLGWENVSTGALAIAAVGAIGRLLIAIAQARVDHGREQAEFRKHLRAPIAPVRAVPCTRIGVDPAAATILPGGKEPQYLPRAIDGELHDALVRALDGTSSSPDRAESWLVVLCGPSKVGKSRTLYEALRKLCDEGRDLVLIAPTDGDSLRSLLPEDLKRRSKSQRPVLWLDDLETFVAKKVNIETLRDWHEKTGAIVVGTYGGKGSDLVRPDRAKELTSLVDSLLLHAKKIGLGVTTPAELSQLPVELSAGDQEIVERYGLAAALVAADLLQQRFMVERQAVAEPASPAGKAVVRAAIDWARCGRVDPISKARLRQLWPSYLEPEGTSAGDESFEAGLKWALRPVAGQISLLMERDGYQAYDYAVLLGAGGPNPSPPKEEAWDCALDTDDPRQILAVGVSASDHGLRERAGKAMELISDGRDKRVAATALFNLGVLADKRGDLDAAGDAWRRAMALGSGGAAFNLALLMEELGEPEASIAAYRKAAELEHENGALNLASLLEKRGETDEAISVLRTGMEHGSGKCACNLGILLEEEGRTEEAEKAFREAIVLGDPKGAYNLGVRKIEAGEKDEALAVLQRGMAMGDGESASNVGSLLWEANRMKEAEEAYRKSTKLKCGPGACNLGRLLLSQDREDEAIEAFREAMELEDGEGAFELGRMLIKRGRVEESVAALRKSMALGNPHGAIAVGVRQQELGEFSKARESFQIALDSDDPKAVEAATERLQELPE